MGAGSCAAWSGPDAGATPPLVARAPAKINLGLFVGETRADGRHELATVMQSISLADELALERAPAGAGGDQVICAGVDGENLAARALERFRAATGWEGPPLRLRIDKRVPVGAGLGGGSGDAAAALRLAAAAAGVADEELLLALARGLGADVPAQVRPGRWLATGAGERLQALPDPARPFGVLVLPAAQQLSTAKVYAQLDARRRRHRAAPEPAEQAERAPALADRARALGEALGAGAGLPPAELLANELQDAAIDLCPAIEETLARARSTGAQVAMVSGSGPTVVALFGGDGGVALAHDAARALEGEGPAPHVAVPVGAELARARCRSVGQN